MRNQIIRDLTKDFTNSLRLVERIVFYLTNHLGQRETFTVRISSREATWTAPLQLEGFPGSIMTG